MPAAPTLLLLVPLLYLAAALIPERLVTGQRRWTIALAAGAAAPLLALLATADVVAGHGGISRLSAGPWLPVTVGVRLDALTVVMLLLITFIAAVILRFSRRYLDGEVGLSRHVRWFLATMAAVSLLVITDDLVVLVAAWTASSLALHQLLTFYGERPSALIAAHKKFLASRAADVALVGAVALIWGTTGTQRIGDLLAASAAMPAMPAALQLAGLLLAVGVILRSAQLPFHGWLIQVMEAPTPVSAFLHAGIVNIGGFVLIRLAPLSGRLDAAQVLLVIVGTVTAVLAALVMTTRVSVKVALAWSTCAQMGFMLLECGLGAYGLALMHLVGHSLYKAHAFLASGRTVEQQMLQRMTPAPARVSAGAWLLAGVLSASVVVAVGTALGVVTHADQELRVAALILAFALAPLFLLDATKDAGTMMRRFGVAVGVAALYATLHAAFAGMAPSTAGAPTNHALRLAIVVVCFVLLYVVQAIIAARPKGRVASALYPACFAGFYLDELYTRLTFRLWPPRVLTVRPMQGRAGMPVLREIAA
jgi:NAD(P)H-quinone oxidoreductase subunit 5